MNSYVALLRGVNLGNRRLKMDRLAGLFEEIGFTQVSTFIASGNVLFESEAARSIELEERIQHHLEDSLGYAVDTFVRTRAEVAVVAAYRPFSAADLDDPGNTVHAVFLRKALSAEAALQLVACETAVDAFHVAGREFYWLCRVKTNESRVWSSPAMKAVALPSMTMRNMTMLRALAAKHPASTT